MAFPGASEEVTKLHGLLAFYESENVRLKEELAQARHEVGALKEHGQNENKRFHSLSKKMTSLETNARLEKRASDGLTKKAAALDIECQLLREQDKVFREEQQMNRRKVKEYEDTLCDDRAKRLRDMHECELLRRKNAELAGLKCVSDADAVQARKELLECMQKLDTALARLEIAQRTMESQGEEMLSLNREVVALKETIANMGDSILRLERVAAERTAERDVLEQESSHLRSELVQMASTHSERSIAYGGSRVGSAQSSRSRPGTTGGGLRASFSASSPTVSGLFFPPSPSSAAVSFGGSTIFDDSYRPSSSSRLLSPVATLGRPKSQQQLVVAPGSFSSGCDSPSRSKPSTPLPAPAIKRSVQLTNLDTNLPDSLSPSFPNNIVDDAVSEESKAASQPQPKLVVGEGSAVRGRDGTKKQTLGVATKLRTMYVGSGLNYKSDPIPQPKESAKQVLRKILMDFESQ